MTGPPTSGAGDRFSKVLQDPRFRRPSKKSTKIKVDDRFKGIFTDKKFTRPYSVDKYGRKIDDVKGASKKEMEKFYRLEQDEDQEDLENGVDNSSKGEFVDTDVSEIEDDYSSTDDDKEEEEEEVDSDSEVEVTAPLEDAFALHPLVNTDVVLGDASRRLAIVNIDWDQLKAVDLYVLLSAFKPPMGIISSVKIYPSEFGKERLAKEAREGPPKEIFGSNNVSGAVAEEDSYGEDSESESDCDPLKDLKEASSRTLVEESGNFDQNALRKYQLERLRYYYAIVECDSIATAAAIYHHCDGREFETSTNTIDVRYVPDEVVFEEDEVTDSSRGAPKKYTPKPGMVTDALQRSNVKLTWDQDDPDRRRITRVNPGKIDYEEADIKAYLASSESEGEDEEGGVGADSKSKEDKIARYRALLLSSTGKNDKSDVFERRSHRDNDQLDITFTSGMNGSDSDSEGEEGLEGLEDDSDSANENEIDQNEDDERVAVFDENGDLVTKLDEVKVDDKKKQRFGKKVEEKFVVQKDWNKSKSSGKGGKKMRKRESDLVDSKTDSNNNNNTEEASEFSVNLQDDRFKAVFESADYAIDPTASNFKKTKGMEAIIQERQKRKKREEEGRDAERVQKKNRRA